MLRWWRLLRLRLEASWQCRRLSRRAGRALRRGDLEEWDRVTTVLRRALRRYRRRKQAYERWKEE